MIPLSVVIPCYKTGENLHQVVAELKEHLCQNFDFEVLLVNDGSDDNTWEIIRDICSKELNFKGINHWRNFGEFNAVMTGLRNASKNNVVIIDDDLQNPPSEIKKLTDKLSEGYDVVYGRFEKRNHSWFRGIGGFFNDFAARVILRKPKGLYLSSFKAMRLDFVRELTRFQTPFVYIDGLILWITRKITEVPVIHRPRAYAQSNYTFIKLLRVQMNLILGFSILPLRAATLLGVITGITGFFLTIGVLVEYLLVDLPPGWASIICLLLLLCGAILVILGILGEYLGRILLLANHLPQAIVREKIGFSKVSNTKSEQNLF